MQVQKKKQPYVSATFFRVYEGLEPLMLTGGRAHLALYETYKCRQCTAL